MTMALTQVSDNGLTNTGVTAATYGSSSAIPSLTIDAKGRVTAASTNSIDSTSISNGTSNVSVSANSNIDFVRAGNTEAVVVDGGIKFSDSKKALFGTGDDLEIYHDGSTNIIDGRFHPIQIKHGSEVHIKCTDDNAVELFYNNAERLKTKGDGVNIIGELECDSLDVDGSSAFSGNLNLDDSVRLRCGTNGDLDIYHDGSNSYIDHDGAGDFIIRTQSGGENLYIKAASHLILRTAGDENAIYCTANGSVQLMYNNSAKLFTKSDGIEIEGHCYPESTNAYDLGASGKRWRNVYTNDLHLSNEGSANDVDGTWGNYTIQEGEDDLFLINRRNGKKYKFNLTEVN